MFEVFPDNLKTRERPAPQSSRAPLQRVLATGRPDTMAVQRYDVRRPLVGVVVLRSDIGYA